MKKRLVALMLAVVFVMSLLPVMASGAASITVTPDKTSVKAGDELTFTIALANADNLNDIQFTFNYDSSMLEFKKANHLLSQVDWKYADVKGQGKIGVLYTFAPDAPFSGSGDILQLTFAVKATAAGGKLSYGISNVVEPVDAAVGTMPEVGIADNSVAGLFGIKTDKTALKLGDRVKVTLTADKLKLKGMQAELCYPSDVLSYVDGEFAQSIADDAMTEGIEDKGGYINVLFASQNDIEITGDVLTLEFEVKNTAPSGKITFEAKNFDLSSTEVAQFTSAAVQTGEINVTAGQPRVTVSANRKSVTPGTTVNILFAVSDVVDFRGMECVINYDSDVFEASDVEAIYGATVCSSNEIEPGKVKVEYALDSALNTDCYIFRLPLVAKKNAENSRVFVTDFLPDPEAVAAPKAVSIDVCEEAIDAEITVSKDKERATVGDEVTYSFDIDGCIQGVEFVIKYDEDKLEPVGHTAGLFEDSDASWDILKFIKVFDYDECVDVKGNLFKLKFKVKADAGIGTASVSVDGVESRQNIKVVQAEDLELFDGDIAAIISTAVDKSIAAHGDEVSYTINLETARAVDGMQMAFNYDSDRLEYASNDIDEFEANIKSCTDKGNGTIGITFTLNTDPRVILGKLVTLKFKVKETAEKGKAYASVTNPMLVENAGAAFECESIAPVRIVNRFGFYEMTSAETVFNVGDEFDVDVWLKNADEAEGADFRISYDENAFDCVGATANDDLGIPFGGYEITSCKFSAVFETYRSDDALKLFTLRMKAKGGVGDTEIKFLEPELATKIADETNVPNVPEVKNLGLYVNTDQDMADKVIAKINAIGDVTLESGDAIAAAEAAYAELTDDQKALVENKEVLSAARKLYDKLVDDRAKADAVIAKIKAIGDVILESGDAIAAAEAAYAELTDDQKALVDNTETLSAARKLYDKLVDDRVKADAVIAKIKAIGDVTLESGDAIATAEAAYAELTDDQKALVDNKEALENARAAYDKAVADAARVAAVIALIEEIGEPDINSIEKINAAQAAYDELEEELQGRVTNVDALNSAKEIYSSQKKAVDDVIALIDLIEAPVTINSEEAIEAAEVAYNALSEAQKAHVSNAEALAEYRTAFDAIRSVNFNTDGANELETVYVNAGEKLEKPEVTKSGYTFSGWYTDAEYEKAWDFDNDVVTEDMTLYAKWKKNGGGGGGSSAAKPTPTPTPTPTTTPEVDEKTDPTPDKPDETNTENVVFTDTTGHWAKTSIEKLFGLGIVRGATETTYEPDRNVTRAEFAAMLVRLLGLESENEAIFDDVSEEEWYFSAVGAAAKAGIVKGYDGKFRPGDNISRQETAVMVSAVYDLLELEMPTLNGLDCFIDKDDIAPWAASCVDKLASAGIINGYDDMSFRPIANTTRAHAAAMIDALLSKKG